MSRISLLFLLKNLFQFEIAFSDIWIFLTPKWDGSRLLFFVERPTLVFLNDADYNTAYIRQTLSSVSLAFYHFFSILIKFNNTWPRMLKHLCMTLLTTWQVLTYFNRFWRVQTHSWEVHTFDSELVATSWIKQTLVHRFRWTKIFSLKL